MAGTAHSRVSMIGNAWLVTCRNCGASDLVGPGHPATADRGDGTHELSDRTRIRHAHKTGCTPDPEDGYPLDFSFTAAGGAR
jgi:hypothetical protein